MANKKVLVGGTVVTLDPTSHVFDPGVVVVEDSSIVYVGPVEGYAYEKKDEIFRLTDHLILPGLVNAHTHSAMTYMRGLIDDVDSIQWFAREQEIEKRMSCEDLYWAALLGCYEMVRNGVTCIADRFSHMDVIAQAIQESGLRAVIAPSIADIGRTIDLDAAVDLVEQWGTSSENRISCGLGPIGPDTSSTGLLEEIRHIANRLRAPIFIHLAQSQQEVEVVRKRGFKGAAYYLNAIGFLGPDVIAAHCIYLSEEEVAILADTGTKIVHCPTSNAKIEGRVAPIGSMLEKEVEVGLGTDCAACNNTMDLFEEMKLAALLNKVNAGDPTSFPVKKIVSMATIEGARILGLERQIGSLEIGKKADIIALDKSGLHLQPWCDIYSHLVYCARGSDVRSVFIDGRPIMLHGEFLAADLDELLSRAEEWRQEVVNAF